MASLYAKQKSPYWYLQQRDALTGKLLNRSTGCRRAVPEETTAARKMRAEAEARELSVPKLQSGEEWGAWVPGWLAIKYAETEETLLRSRKAWKAMLTYLRALGIRSARVLRREHVLNYIAWRTGPEGIEAGLRRARHNTALLEIKFLAIIMREAVERKLADANVCLQLGVKRVRGKVKREITDEEVAQIEAALVTDDEVRRPYNEAMQISWQVAMLQVCRLAETRVALRDVDLEEGTITFRAKGDRDHTAMLHPELRPLMVRLKQGGREHAFAMPGGFSRKWQDFFKRHRIADLSFHSTRVTGVTRLRRKGVDVRIAMEFVGHSSVLMHRIYQRQRKDEQGAAIAALSRGDGSPSSGMSGSP